MLKDVFHNECLLLNSVFPRGNFFHRDKHRVFCFPDERGKRQVYRKEGPSFCFPDESALISVLSKCGTKPGGGLVPLLGFLP